jgi:hypothetical protein
LNTNRELANKYPSFLPNLCETFFWLTEIFLET